MKKAKIMALILAVLMIALPLISCDSGNTGEDTDTEDNGETGKDVTITVSMKVKDLSGKVIYEVASYTYSGEAPTPIDLIDDYFYMELDPLTVVIDETNDIRTIISIGEVEAGEVTGESGIPGETQVLYTTWWWWNLNGKESTTSPDGYTVKNGDSIEFFLKKVSPETTKKK